MRPVVFFLHRATLEYPKGANPSMAKLILSWIPPLRDGDRCQLLYPEKTPRCHRVSGAVMGLGKRHACALTLTNPPHTCVCHAWLVRQTQPRCLNQTKLFQFLCSLSVCVSCPAPAPAAASGVVEESGVVEGSEGGEGCGGDIWRCLKISVQCTNPV